MNLTADLAGYGINAMKKLSVLSLLFATLTCALLAKSGPVIRKEIKEEKKEDEKKEEVVKKTPSDGIVKGLFTDDEIIAVMEDFLTNDDSLRSEQVRCDLIDILV